MLSLESDTIVAQATPSGEGSVGIIRLSGPQALSILSEIFRGLTQPKNFESHKLYLGVIVCHSRGLHKEGHGMGGNPDWTPASAGVTALDQALVVYFEKGKSFTGEEIVEIQAHSSPLVLRQIIELCIKHGARMAEPGEFSKRAFLNGKIDLTQAEAIADLIHAKSEGAAKNALSQLGGFFSLTIDAIRQKFIALLASLEIGFDFSEEDVVLFDKKKALEDLQLIQSDLQKLLDSYQTGQLYKEGLKIALIGRPNVGKSSLLNVLLRENRAIVHHEPGTTRDVVMGERKIEGINCFFYDTAGVRENAGPVETEGIKRSELVMEKADLILLLLDKSKPFLDEDEALYAKIKQKSHIIVYSKCDLDPIWTKDYAPSISLSSKTESGIDELLKIIYDISIKSSLSTDQNYVLNNVRHKGVIEKILVKLQYLTKIIKNEKINEESLVEEFRIIISDLDQITGKISNEQVLDEIFSRFCIGK